VVRRGPKPANTVRPPHGQDQFPEGVRRDIGRLVALLTAPSWQEVIRWSTELPADLRDLNERELAYVEMVSMKIVQRWRSQGNGPFYRNQAGIRYSLRDVWEWRQRGRQRATAEGIRRGSRRSHPLTGFQAE